MNLTESVTHRMYHEVDWINLEAMEKGVSHGTSGASAHTTAKGYCITLQKGDVVTICDEGHPRGKGEFTRTTVHIHL